ncbi:MAG: Mov34/MPN/PAD-1 family protein [Methanosarcinaceae archaeon]|jgi:proteasome lid subunit RPN8/RPN11|nr:Mov34/MPN/PAD-1 family protein [Methanosarcinaceae archaeon]NKQ38439.1 metal-dependent protease of the PAD1/JAB1 superfamily [Methanosarcinales archaeon]
MKIRGIARSTLEFVLEVSKSCHPNEFAGLMQARDDIISEIMILPGTESGETSAIMHIYMMPSVRSIGSVHSHPSPNTTPSNADLALFSKTGNYHIIVGAPYNENSWTCYNEKGEKIKLEVLDVDLGNDDDWELV